MEVFFGVVWLLSVLAIVEPIKRQSDNGRLLGISNSTFKYMGGHTSFHTLVWQSNRFLVPFPVEAVRIRNLVASSDERGLVRDAIVLKILEFSRYSFIIVHERVFELMGKFLDFKRENGSSLERELYKEMSVTQFMDRLLRKRPVMFLEDNSILRSGQKVREGWELIGSSQEKPPLLLKDYMSYDEIKISAFLVYSGGSFFINNGDRNNRGIPQKFGEYEDSGVVIGASGPRFGRNNVMDYQEIVLTPDQNTAENGYGVGGPKVNPVAAARLKLFADLYDVDYFESFDKIKEGPDVLRLQPGHAVYGMASILIRRFRLTAETVLMAAEYHGALERQSIFLRIVGYGLGFLKYPGWYDERKYFMIAFRQAIEGLSFEYITDINFVWLHEGADEEFGIKDGERLGRITIHFSDNEGQDSLSGVHKGKLLVITSARDGNALPGNEFWEGSFDGSGDSSTACSTQVAELHNPYINPHITGTRALIASPKYNRMFTVAEFTRKPV